MNKSTFFMEKLIRKKSFSDWLTSTSQSINDSVVILISAKDAAT